MKRTIIFIAAILMFTGAVGCSRNADSDTAESLYTETTVESANEILSEKDKEEEKEDSEDSTESDVSAVSENEMAVPSSATNSKPTVTPPEDETPPSTTSTPSQPPVTSTSPSEPPAPAAPIYTQKDFDEIIAVVREYAESQTDIKFAWKPSMKKDDGASGYHDTPNLSRDGKERLIRELKYNVDLTVKLLMDQTKGIISCTVDYNILWYEQDRYFFQEPGKDIFFVLLYG